MRPNDAWTFGDSLGWGRGEADGWGDGSGEGSGWGWGSVGFDGFNVDCILRDGGGSGDGWGWGSGSGDGDCFSSGYGYGSGSGPGNGSGSGDGWGEGWGRELPTSSHGHRSRAIRRFPPSKKVLDERRPPAPWILLTEEPEPSLAPSEEGNGGV